MVMVRSDDRKGATMMGIVGNMIDCGTGEVRDRDGGKPQRQ
jgi:hypothetical protein